MMLLRHERENMACKITSAKTITSLITLINKMQTKQCCIVHTMNEAVFHAKNPNWIVTNRKHLEVNQVLVGCSSEK